MAVSTVGCYKGTWYENEEMAENEEIDADYTLYEIARCDRDALREVITLYTAWYDGNWKEYIQAKFYVLSLDDIYKALAENKLILAITSVEKNQPESYTNARTLLEDIDTLFQQKNEHAHHHVRYKERMDLV